MKRMRGLRTLLAVLALGWLVSPALAEPPPRAPARQEGRAVPLPPAAAAQRPPVRESDSSGGLEAQVRELSLKVDQMAGRQKELSDKLDKVLQNQRQILEELDRIRMRV
ncbi:MAG: hypothetical protein HYZ93_04980 [Candidatus Omnitrophica bacterium]|nr:hypothetical protein [Candidatus Omnitrophota bacterium]